MMPKRPVIHYLVKTEVSLKTVGKGIKLKINWEVLNTLEKKNDFKCP